MSTADTANQTTTSTPKAFSLWRFLDALTRHPAMLVVLGFFLTGIVGNRLTQKVDEDNRHRAAVTKDFDSLRSSIDDLRSSFELYASGVKHLMMTLQVGETGENRQQALKDYSAAYAQWVQHRVTDYTLIEQRFADTDGGDIVVSVGNLLEIGTEQLDNCIQRHLTQPNGQKLKSDQSLECEAMFPVSAYNVSSRLLSLRLCMRMLAMSIRPLPAHDFDPLPARSLQTDQFLRRMDSACSPKELAGLDMPLRNASPAGTFVKP
ncbi:hypothetical protein [Burkholderia anthina]|uniref:hypothetical protein n=1 Tax=Burkholderia anthina TaxID=179879 RepID=UPI000B042EC9|nr:hypothetical protein [Burkholderia anthina]